MRTLTVLGHAKINLRLKVLGALADGYHAIETLFQSVGLADEVVIGLGGRGIDLKVEGHEVPEREENLAYRAAGRLLASARETTGVQIRLTKRIPPGSGLGGGSADAAAVLEGLNRLLGQPLRERRLKVLAGDLGADVPFALTGGTAWGWGRGDRLLCLDPLPPSPVGIVLPPVKVETAWAYQALEPRLTKGRGAGSFTIPLGAIYERRSLLRLLENDFESVVFAHHPLLGEIKTYLLSSGAEGALLSGSGSALVALYRSDEDRDRSLAGCRERFGVEVFPTTFVSQGISVVSESK